jgi:hypothetical protein
MRRFAALLLTAAAAVALAGCAVSITDSEATDAGSLSGEPVPRATPAAPSPTSRPTDDAADRPADDTAIAEPAVTRDQAIAAASTTLACTPGLVVSQIGAVVRIEGPCDEVTVNADAAVVVVDDVSRLRVAGTGTAVFALGIGELTVTGDASGVWWRGDAPVVTDTGAGNVIGREPR